MSQRRDNWCGDNLAEDDEDDDDETQHFNWRNNPIRALFDNPSQRSHQSSLDYEDDLDYNPPRYEEKVQENCRQPEDR
jgi:hypothetical protein